MNTNYSGGRSGQSEGTIARLDQACLRFEDAWKAGKIPRLADYLVEAEDPLRLDFLRDLLAIDIAYRRAASMAVDWREYSTLTEAEQQLAKKFIQSADACEAGSDSATRPDGLGDTDATEKWSPKPLQLLDSRFQISQSLGSGSFGSVYLAMDRVASPGGD